MGRSIISKERLLNATSVAASGTGYTNSRKFHDCDGTAVVLIIVTGTGTCTITQQCSTDEVTFYDPETASGAAGAVEDSIVATAGRYLSFTPVLCDWIRFKIVETGTSNAVVVTLTLAYRVEVL